MTASRSSRKNSENRSPLFEHGKIQPQAIDLEEAVLGAVMIDRTCISTVMGIITEEAFYKPEHSIVYRACTALYDKNKPVDILTVTEKLRETGELESIGGPYYITTLTDRVASSRNVEEHCRILQQKQISREIIRVGSEAIHSAYDDTVDPFDCLSMFESSITKINEIYANGASIKSLSRIMGDVEKSMIERENMYKRGQANGIPTGLLWLDKKTVGWQKADLVILAARPSMGKTALMVHHALAAAKAGIPVCIYSLEMSSLLIGNRIILAMADIDVSRFQKGAMNEMDWDRFYQARDFLSGLPVYIDDNAVVTTRYIKSHSKMMKDRGQCGIVFVDYLQLADMRSDQKNRNREQEVSQAAREFKIIAKTLDIPVILLSQLSRECEKRGDKRPLLSDLRESGAIEQDADIVIFLYRPDYYGLKGPGGQDMKGIGYMIISKGRNIGTGEIPFRHNETMSQIYDYDVEYEQNKY